MSAQPEQFIKTTSPGRLGTGLDGVKTAVLQLSLFAVADLESAPSAGKSSHDAVKKLLLDMAAAFKLEEEMARQDALNALADDDNFAVYSVGRGYEPEDKFTAKINDEFKYNDEPAPGDELRF